MSKSKQRYCECGNPVYGRKRKCDECKELDAQPKGHKCKSEFNCDNILYGKERICPACKEKRRIESRKRICPKLGHEFYLEDHQHGGETFSKEYKEILIKYWLYQRIVDFIDNPDKYLPGMDRNIQINDYSSRARNDVQSTSNFPEFKIRYEFENVSSQWDKKVTYDHINSMTYIIKKYINLCFEDGAKYKNRNVFYDYYKKYAVQFPVLQKHNQDLIKFQESGVTPEQYIDVVGSIKGKTREESIEIIRPHFING